MFSFLVGVLLVRIVRLFPSLDGISQVLLEEQVVSGSVGHSELLVHLGVTEGELGIHEHTAEVFVCTEGTAHRTNGLTSVSTQQEDSRGLVVLLHPSVECVVDDVVEGLALGASIKHIVLLQHHAFVWGGKVHDVLVTVAQHISSLLLPFGIGADEFRLVVAAQAFHMNIEDTFASLAVGHGDHVAHEWESVADHPAWESILQMEVSSQPGIVCKGCVSWLEVDQVHAILLKVADQISVFHQMFSSILHTFCISRARFVHIRRHKHTQVFLRESGLSLVVTERLVPGESDLSKVVVHSDVHAVLVFRVESELSVVSTVPDANQFAALDFVSQDVAVDEHGIGPFSSVPMVVQLEFNEFPVVAYQTGIEPIVVTVASRASSHVLDTKTDVVVTLFRTEVLSEIVDSHLPEVSVFNRFLVYVSDLERFLVATSQDDVVDESPHIVSNLLLQIVLSKVVAFDQVSQFPRVRI